MAKRDRNKGDAGQTKSETTAAAHVIFNDPDQPKAPVTTENISKTVKQAVHEEIAKAFAAREKQELKDLKPQAPTVKNPKARGRFKSDHVPFNPVKDETPAAPKKLKVRLKPTVAPEEKINTPTGISINELAERIKKQEPTPSKPKVRLKAPTPFNLVPNKTEEPTAAAVLGKTVSSKSPSLNKPAEKFESVSNPENLNVESLVKRMQAAEQSNKVEKTTKPLTADEKKQSRSDAAQALAALGFKKNEFQGLLDKVDHIEDTTEKIRMVLKLKADPHAKIPKSELPAAVEQAKEDVKAPIKPINPLTKKAYDTEAPKVEPAKSPEPKQLGLDLKQPPPALELKPSPGNVSPVTPQGPSLPQASTNGQKIYDQGISDQNKAADDKKEEDEKKAAKAQAERDKRVEKQLKEISDKISSKGVFDLIAQSISGLLKNLLPTILKPLLGALPSILGVLGKATLVIGVGVAAYEGMKAILSHFGYTGETLGKAAESVGDFFSGTKAKKEAADLAEKKRFTESMNNKLSGTGYTFSEGAYHDKDGKNLSVTQLPPDVRSKVATAPVTAQAIAQPVTSKLEAQAPKAQSDTAAQKIAPPPAPQAQEAPQVHVHQDNRQTNVAPPASSNDGGALIKVRNDEPSAAGLIASIFEHPVSYGAVYRM